MDATSAANAINENEKKRQRILDLARKMMISDMASPNPCVANLDDVIMVAEGWIMDEDDYELPEDMRVTN